MHVLEKKRIRLLRCPGSVLLAYVEGKGVVVVAKTGHPARRDSFAAAGNGRAQPVEVGRPDRPRRARRFGRDPPGRLLIAFVLRQHEARRGSDVLGGDAAHPGASRSDVQLSHERVFDALVQVSVRVEELLRINQRVQASHERSEVELEAAADAVSAGGLEKENSSKRRRWRSS
jgi:hypothetical protein